MPVVHVRALPPGGGPEQVEAMLGGVVAAVSTAVAGAPAGTWATFAALERQALGERHLAQGGIAFVDLWLRPRDEATARGALGAACGAVADGLGLPREDVWGALHLVEPGRVFAGGGILD